MSSLDDLEVQTLAGENCNGENPSKMKRDEESGQGEILSEDLSGQQEESDLNLEEKDSEVEEDENDYYDPEEYDEEEAGLTDLENSLYQICAAVPMEEEKECVSGLLSEIVRKQALFHFPAKSILRARAVSQIWKQWISSPFFIHMHSQSSRDLSGVFFHPSRDDQPFYSSFDNICHGLPSPPLSFLPEPIIVLASTNGLVCCWGRVTYLFYICNPMTREWTTLPKSINEYCSEPTAVIVFDELFECSYSADYHLVCARQLGEEDHGFIYGFEVFSSKNWAWRASVQICTIGKLVPESGVAVWGSAYWRTMKPSVVKYYPITDTWFLIQWPAWSRGRERWELGQVGQQLCCTCTYKDMGKVFVLVDEVRGIWTVKRKFRRLRMRYGMLEEEDEWPVPLRAQGGRMMPFLGGRTVFTRNFIGTSERELEGIAPEYWETMVPFVSSLLPVKRNDCNSQTNLNVNSEAPESSCRSV